MAKAAVPVNGQASTALGLNLRKVVIKQIVPERGVAICEDSSNYSTEIPYRVQNAKGRKPQVGEIWYVDRSLGPWTFAAFVAADDTAFTTTEDQTTFSNGLVIPDGKQLQIGVVPASVLASIAVRRANATDSIVGFGVGTDSISRYVVYADGKMQWGPGGSTVRDTTVVRGDTSTLVVSNFIHQSGVGTALLASAGSVNLTGSGDITILTVTIATVASRSYEISCSWGGVLPGGTSTNNRYTFHIKRGATNIMSQRLVADGNNNEQCGGSMIVPDTPGAAASTVYTFTAAHDTGTDASSLIGPASLIVKGLG